MYNVAEFTEFILVAVIAVIAVVYFCLQLPKSILWSHKKTICYKYCTYYNTSLVKQTYTKLSPPKIQNPAEEPTCCIADKPDLKQNKKEKSNFCKNLHPCELLTSITVK